jgi:hypothetical protein
MTKGGGKVALGRSNESTQLLLSQGCGRGKAGPSLPPLLLLLLLLLLTSLAGACSLLAPKRMVATKVCNGTLNTVSLRPST